jgi:hypothetical protein
MATVLRCDGGLVGGVTAHSIDRSPVSQWQDVLRGDGKGAGTVNRT